jgi:hypothetical protein
MKKSIEMELPSLPNFIRSKEETKDSGSAVVDIASFTDEELKAIGIEWTQALIEKARERRKDVNK